MGKAGIEPALPNGTCFTDRLQDHLCLARRPESHPLWQVETFTLRSACACHLSERQLRRSWVSSMTFWEAV